MSISVLLALLLLAAIAAYTLGYKRALVTAHTVGRRSLHSLPSYHGAFTAFWTVCPAVLFILLWLGLSENWIARQAWSTLPDSFQMMSEQERSLVMNQVYALSQGKEDIDNAESELLTAAKSIHSMRDNSLTLLWIISALLVLLSGLFAFSRIRLEFRARNQVEIVMQVLFFLSSLLAVLTTLGILFSVVFESLLFFQKVSPIEFFFGTHWSPQIALRSDQVGAAGAFGVVPLFWGTLMISFIAMAVSGPLGLMSAIYLSEYATPHLRSTVKPVLEVLAGIPTVVYGFFAAVTLAPFIRDLGETLNLTVSSESALACGLVMGVMIIPFISSIADDVIHAVPQAMRDGSYGLGATRSETIRKVIIPAALPGIVGGMMLAISRAIGETMIVVMAAGLTASLTFNPLESVTTVTVQIVTLLIGDQEFDSPKTLAAFALGMLLFVVTLALNVIALHIVNKYREQYE